MFKGRYHGANDYVEMTEGLDRSMLADLGARRRRWFLSIIAVLLALVVICPWVITTPAAFNWLSRVAPPLAKLLSPNAGSAEENGIRAQVVEAAWEGETLKIHLTLEDLEADRLNENTAPRWCSYEQDESASCTCTQDYDEETGLLHLYLTCKPAEDMQSFDWRRWVTVHVMDLSTRHHESANQQPIPMTLTDCAELHFSTTGSVSYLEDQLTTSIATIQEGQDITCMTVIDDEFHVQVRTRQDTNLRLYQLILSGPNGERVQQISQSEAGEYTNWVFALGDRDIHDCSLSVWLSPDEMVEGTWTVHVSPVTED